jgi:hypothetical protein
MTDLKEKLILRRLDEVYCRLAPSKIHGVGVFAIKQIPLGINPFKGSYMAQEAIVVNKCKIKDEGKEILKMLHDYHPTSDDKLQIISNFPNSLIWSNFINYGSNPNIELMTDGEWKTLRIVEKGEELIEDPKRLLNPDGSQKIFKVTSKQYPSLSYN